jgi:hypothetical protein
MRIDAVPRLWYLVLWVTLGTLHVVGSYWAHRLAIRHENARLIDLQIRN